MRHKIQSGILGHKQIIQSHPENQTKRIIHKKKRTYRIVDFAVPRDHIVKIKENKRSDMYLDLARELKKLWSIKEDEKRPSRLCNLTDLNNVIIVKIN